MRKLILGQSLFEVVVALAIVSLIIVGVVILGTNSIRNSSFARDKTLATKYNQEAAEWLRGQRDNSWSAFYSKATSSSNWCLLALSWSSAKMGTCGSSDLISGTPFKRQLVFTVLDANNIQVAVKVSWSDGAGMHDVTSVTIFTNWKLQ